MLRGESWCYQGGDDYYRLGSIYRDFFSSPLSYRVYASAGDPPAEPSSCEKRLVELKAKYDPQPVINSITNSSAASQPPLPTSQVSIPRTPISALINTSTVQIGSWSQDSQYWFFAIPELSGKQISVSLDFLNSKTGKVCTAGPKYQGIFGSELPPRLAARRSPAIPFCKWGPGSGYPLPTRCRESDSTLSGNLYPNFDPIF